MPDFESTIPVLRIFDLAKACEFPLDFFGFAWNTEHRSEPAGPFGNRLVFSARTEGG
jgi:hypothetical protein